MNMMQDKKVAVLRPLMLVVLISVVPVSAEAGQWSTTTSTDKMTGEISAYATGPQTTPTKPFGFPYVGVEGWLGFGCNGRKEWAFIGFSESPNLTNTSARDGGYSTLSTRIRWDKHVEQIEMSQNWGESFLHFQNGAAAITNMINAGTALLELNWYGEGTVYFEFMLDGSTQAIKNARAKCAAVRESDTSPAQSSTNKIDRVPQQIQALQQIKPCWNLPAGAVFDEDMVVEINVNVNPDGTIRTARIVDTTRLARDSRFRAFAESALRAALNPSCGPFSFPPNAYENWKNITLRFNPRD